MSDPWFNPNLLGGIVGSAIGVLGGVWGGLAGALAPRGRAKVLVLGYAWALLLASALLLATGLAALLCGQPYGVWYGLGLSGLIGLAVLAPNLYVVRGVYRKAEERKLAAHDLAGPPSAGAN